MAKAGEFVDLKEVYPPVPDADKIQFVEMDDLGEKAYEKSKNTKIVLTLGQLAFHFRQNLLQERKINSVPCFTSFPIVFFTRSS